MVEEILEDCLMVLVYRHDQLAHPDRWLLRTVRFRCLRYWRRQRFELCLKVQKEILLWLEDEACDDGEREGRRRELEARLADLPERCRKLLEEVFQLRPPEAPEPPKGRELFPRGNVHTPESPTIRCMNLLLRNLAADPPADLESLGSL